MFRWLLFCIALCGGAFALVQYGVPKLQELGYLDVADVIPDEPEENGPNAASNSGNDAVTVIAVAQGANSRRLAGITVPDARLIPVDRQEVPAERDGRIVAIGSEIKPGEVVPADKKISALVAFLAIDITAVPDGKDTPADKIITFPGSDRKYRRWVEGDPVTPGMLMVAREPKELRRLEVGDHIVKDQLLALIDPELAMTELAIKSALVDAAASENRASAATKLEFERRVLGMERARARVPGSVSDDDYETAKLQVRRYREEEIAKGAAIIKSQQELLQAATILKKHEVRSTIDGVVKVIYKNRGDAVKNLEPILQVQNPHWMRVEGLLEVQEARAVRPGMEALVEPSQPESPKLVLRGHLLEVTSVAVSKGPQPIIVSGSEDRTLRGWSAANGQQIWQINHRSSVRSVVCTPPTAEANLALTGCADGSVRIVNLDALPKESPREMSERHSGAVTCAAFTPDGVLCATGGDDRAICLWETATGKLLNRVTLAHRAAISSLQFTPENKLVSAGRDNALSVWTLTSSRTLAKSIEFDRRSGDVAQLGVSPDGQRVLFDQGKELRLLSLADRQIQGVLQNSGSTTNFTTMALFSPDGKTILTNVTSEGRLQLWRAPTPEQPRAAELRQYIWTTGPATCGTIAPDNSFAVTGTQDFRVLVWPMPSAKEIDNKLVAKISLVEGELTTSSRQVRVWAELENPGYLVPGGSASMVILPKSGR